MPCPQDKQPITVVSAVMRADGQPDFALTEVEVTADERANGVHYSLVEADLVQAGYDEPFVHFAPEESPPFLHPAVRQYLGLPPVEDRQPQPALSEDR
jgi:hypothetical protein